MYLLYKNVLQGEFIKKMIAKLAGIAEILKIYDNNVALSSTEGISVFSVWV